MHELAASWTARRAPMARVFLFQQLGSFNSATMRDLRNLNGSDPALD